MRGWRVEVGSLGKSFDKNGSDLRICRGAGETPPGGTLMGS